MGDFNEYVQTTHLDLPYQLARVRKSLLYHFKHATRAYNIKEGRTRRRGFNIEMTSEEWELFQPEARFVAKFHDEYPKPYPKELNQTAIWKIALESPDELNSFFNTADWYKVYVADTVGIISDLSFTYKYHERNEWETEKEEERAHVVVPDSVECTPMGFCHVNYTMTRIVK